MEGTPRVGSTPAKQVRALASFLPIPDYFRVVRMNSAKSSLLVNQVEFSGLYSKEVMEMGLHRPSLEFSFEEQRARSNTFWGAFTLDQ